MIAHSHNSLLGLLLLLLQLVIGSTATADLEEIGYSFWNEGSGGIAVAIVEPTTGRIVDSKVLLDSPKCRMPLKVRRTDQNELVVTNVAKDDPKLFIVDVQGIRATREVMLPALPDELRIAGNQGIVTCEADILAVVDIAKARVKTSWDVGKIYKPKANGPQGIFITPDQRYAVVAFQKDSKSGKKLGSRLAIYELPKMLRVADLLLPRNRPELHIQDSPKDQGPGPEIVFVSGNTLFVTLDLYGGVGFMDWPAAIKNDVHNWSEISTELGGAWGHAFPDRTCPVTLGQHRGILVCNAGKLGGVVLVSLDRRQIIWKRQAPPGLEHPVFLPQLRKAYSVCSGKIKQRQDNAVMKSYSPQKSLYVCDFSTREAIADKPVEVIPLGSDFAMRIARVGKTPLLLIATGTKAEAPNQLTTFDPRNNAILDRKPAVGTIGRFEK